MKVKPADRLIQVSLGLLLVILSALYLWRDTILPILKSKEVLESVPEVVRVPGPSAAWQDRVETARARALEALEADRQRQILSEEQKKADASSGQLKQVEDAGRRP